MLGMTPRGFLLRLVFLTGVLIWAIWKMDREGSAALTWPEFRVLEPASPPPRPPGEAPAVVDPERLVGAMQAAGEAGRSCGAGGARLSVRVGAEGLERAELDGMVSDEVAGCLAGALWGLDWPRARQVVETAVDL